MHFFVFEHIAHPKNFILEKLKLLKKGGVIIFEVPSYSDALFSLYKTKNFKILLFCSSPMVLQHEIDQNSTR